MYEMYEIPGFFAYLRVTKAQATSCLAADPGSRNLVNRRLGRVGWPRAGRNEHGWWAWARIEERFMRSTTAEAGADGC